MTKPHEDAPVAPAKTRGGHNRKERPSNRSSGWSLWPPFWRPDLPFAGTAWRAVRTEAFRVRSQQRGGRVRIDTAITPPVYIRVDGVAKMTFTGWHGRQGSNGAPSEHSRSETQEKKRREQVPTAWNSAKKGKEEISLGIFGRKLGSERNASKTMSSTWGTIVAHPLLDGRQSWNYSGNFMSRRGGHAAVDQFLILNR